ncbi:MAG: tetratricopeptide repeat protein [Xanthobacteraceae bacterium]
MLLVLMASPACAQTPQQQHDQCMNKGGPFSPDQRLRACTAIIQSGRETPRNLAAIFNSRGIAYRDIGDNDRAIADFDEAIRLDPKYADAYNGRGNAYRNKGDLDRAIADYDAAIRLDPKFYFAYVNRGDVYYAKGDVERVIGDYNEVIRLQPDYAYAHYIRGNAYYAKGDFGRAIADYNDAIRLIPNYAIAYNGRGTAFKAKGESDRAIADYNEAIRFDPKYAVAYANRGNAYHDNGDNDRAIADYTDAIRFDSKNFSLYFTRGRLHLYAGEFAKAVADFSQASTLAPAYAYAALWLDIADRRSNRPIRLAEAAKRIDMTKWPAPIIRLYLGKVTPDAVLAAADNPDADTRKGQICEANFYGGELLLLQGRKDDAARLFRLAAADCPKGFIELESAVAELKVLGR